MGHSRFRIRDAEDPWDSRARADSELGVRSWEFGVRGSEFGIRSSFFGMDSFTAPEPRSPASRRPGSAGRTNRRGWVNTVPPRLIALFKPYDILSQFTDAEGRSTLKSLVPIPGIYPVGRLDRDSEGLLLLTDDGRLAHRLTDPRYEHPRTYLVQVEQVPNGEALERLRRGVVLRDGPTRPAEVELL